MSPNRKRSPVHRADPQSTDQPSGALAAFRARVNTGDYNAVIGRHLRRALHEAAADTSLEPEIGALRLALVRLLDEERDPSRLAQSVSRIAGIAIQAARLNHNPDGDCAEIRAHLIRELAAMDAEAAERSQRQAPAWEPDFAVRQ